MVRRRIDGGAARYQEDLAEMEREFEERVETRQKRSFARDYPESARRDKKKTKPPLLLRVLAWCGVILFCFVAGYVGTGYMFKKMGFDKPWPTQKDSNLNAAMEAELSDSGARLDMQKETFSVFYPKDGELMLENVEVVARTLEDNIQETVQKVLKLGGMDAVNVLHVFRDMDTVYLNFSSPFLDCLNEVGEKAGSLLITGIARTMNDNFSLTKVRFLVESRVVSTGTPVDLAAVWQLQR